MLFCVGVIHGDQVWLLPGNAQLFRKFSIVVESSGSAFPIRICCDAPLPHTSAGQPARESFQQFVGALHGRD